MKLCGFSDYSVFVPLFVNAELYYQLVRADSKAFPLKTSHGDKVGTLVLTVDQRLGQYRFDSYSINGYKTSNQEIWL